MQSSATWLTKLKAAELHRLAILIGTPCSGTKPVITRGIQEALSLLPNNDRPKDPRHVGDSDAMSILSIDMGIRNLAYSMWTSSARYTTPEGYLRHGHPTLQAWKKLDISTSNALIPRTGKVDDAQETSGTALTSKESFEPLEYADRAYTLIKHLLDIHRPSHILIERQRFRSGGNANVQEWTIRVGVFEGMLYAVLKTLAASRTYSHPFCVEPVLPARVNRYWFQDPSDSEAAPKTEQNKLTGQETKRAKIELVQKHLRAAMERSGPRLFEIHEDAMSLAQWFANRSVSTNKGVRKTRNAKLIEDSSLTPGILKLDDLADSLLQGLAWMQWQNNRLELRALKERAFGLSGEP